MFNKNADIDSNIFSVGTILQVMTYTNQTEYQIETITKSNGKKEGYITHTLKTVMNDLKYVESAESSSKRYNSSKRSN